MKFSRFASALAAFAMFSPIAAEAYTLDQAARPRENPPAGYSGDVYVDSRGCVYVRANIGNAVNWVPRLTSDRRTVVCGAAPSATSLAGRGGGAPPPPPAPPPPTAVAAVAAAPAATVATTPTRPVVPAAGPAPAAPASSAVTRTLNVTCPADGNTARVRIGGSTVQVNCDPSRRQPVSYIVRHGNGERTRLVANPAPRQVATPAPTVAVRAAPATVSAGSRAALLAEAGVSVVGSRPLVSNSSRVIIGGTPAATGYAYTTPTTAPTVRAPAPSVTTTTTVPGYGSGYNLAPNPDAGRVHIPSGYRPAWDDGRLNPNRGPRSVAGDMAMATVMTIDEVPMRDVNPGQANGLLYQPEPSFFSIFSAKNVEPAATATTTVAAAPTTRTTRATAAPAPAATGHRYVQVGMFNVMSNAERAAAKLTALGLPGRVAKTQSGKTVVIAGPYASASDLQSALSRARRGGFSDAFLRS